jgi:predicted pyridoxine 5'-phosphate oxidase superfamily flavin-nucleotide-binding protein
MSGIYGDPHRQMQELFGTINLADRVRDSIVSTEIAEEHKHFIETRDLFFLSTVDHRGFPTCSYKGGAPGFVKVLDDSKTLVFPSYDGNGMFLSMGNIAANNKVGLLFIDFETPHRVRIHGTASVRADDPLIGEFHGAELVVRVDIAEIFVNCPRYIHKYQRIAASKYVPRTDCPPPLPQWKRIDALQDVLPEHDRQQVETLGGTITPEQYGAKVMKGEA